MTVLRLESLNPGMVLSRDVCDRKGRVLLPAGAELTEKHLRIFQTWGVVEADITGDGGDDQDPAPFADDIDQAALAEAGAAVERLFIHCDPELPVIKELKHACLLRKVSDAS
ncbi:hypothetical protein [Geobacter sp. SVR]|uniref:hypothetical protein n=1 Tax=Geobacter sp. SVR TaxID=2495594 RepID=UPI00143EF8CA|nr:hypothetical protein [Geobacter sp. SVR]BCS54855.1 hypothetical protein GSVR_31630 [Geobacter sp. SVR]GCF86337.1 hypothetical protein GSbR_29370 [Geobacter sp. SVR]